MDKQIIKTYDSDHTYLPRTISHTDNKLAQLITDLPLYIYLNYLSHAPRRPRQTRALYQATSPPEPKKHCKCFSHAQKTSPPASNAGSNYTATIRKFSSPKSTPPETEKKLANRTLPQRSRNAWAPGYFEWSCSAQVSVVTMIEEGSISKM